MGNKNEKQLGFVVVFCKKKLRKFLQCYSLLLLDSSIDIWSKILNVPGGFGDTKASQLQPDGKNTIKIHRNSYNYHSTSYKPQGLDWTEPFVIEFDRFVTIGCQTNHKIEIPK